MSRAKRVCVIGAGPSGMSVLYHFNRLKTQGKEIPEIMCFDKQSDWGGLWKYSWETGEESNHFIYVSLLQYPPVFFFYRDSTTHSVIILVSYPDSSRLQLVAK